MSVQSAKDFLQKTETDQVMKERLEAAPDYEARQQIIQTAGFDFTVDEFTQAIEELAAAAGKELTPEELEGIAAGVGQAGWCPHKGKCSCYWVK
jgi:predicted ribosomally synthesized peptide with nif11-like leader